MICLQQLLVNKLLNAQAYLGYIIHFCRVHVSNLAVQRPITT